MACANNQIHVWKEVLVYPAIIKYKKKKTMILLAAAMNVKEQLISISLIVAYTILCKVH